MASAQINVNQDQEHPRNVAKLNNVERKEYRPNSMAKDSPTLGDKNGHGDHKYDNNIQQGVTRVFKPNKKSQLPSEHEKNINLDNQKQIDSRFKNDCTNTIDPEALRDSGKSNATYMSVKPDENFQFSPGKKPDLPQRGKQPVRRKCGLHRVCVIISIIVAVAVVLGIVAFIVYITCPKPSKECPMPDVKNGNATVNGDVLNEQCKVGYSKTNDEPIKCVEGVWSSPICSLIDCGDPPNNTNGHNHYDNTTFESTARLFCNNGFMLTARGIFECSADGNWSSSFNASCEPHPCGTYSLPAHSHVEEDFSYVNMTMLLRCDDGFAFTGQIEPFLSCENQTWLGNASCEIPGNVTFNPTEPVFVTKSQMSVNCSVTNSPGWKTVLLRKHYYKLNGSEVVVLANVSNGSGIFDYKSAKGLVSPTINAFPVKDGVNIEMKFESLQCGDNGIYMCGIIVGDVDNPVDVKEVNTTVTVIDKSSTFPIITAPPFAYQGTSINASCNGTVGLDEKGQKLGKILLQIKYQGEATFRNLSTEFTFSQEESCQLREFITTSIQVTNAMDNATLRCITTTADREELSNSAQQLKVFVTKVNISTSRQPFDIGYPANISCDIENILGWKVIELRKLCNELETVLCHIHENHSLSGTREHIEIRNVNVTDDSAAFELFFNHTKCSDACPEGGPANFAVFIQVDRDWINESVTVMFNDPPQSPNITSEPEQFYLGQEATIICAGDAGIPGRDMAIKRNGSPVKISTPSSKFDEVDCTANRELKFTFFVSTINQGDIFVCETLMSNGSSLSSNTINVSITEPVLYFTPESKVGEISKSKQIVCVLSEASNLTSVSLFRGASLSSLCTVDTQSGYCNETYYSISGNYTNNGTKFVTTLSIREVRCIDETEFTCQSSSLYTLTTKMNFAITSSVKSPVLRLPTTLVVNQIAEWEDKLNCTADIGYPSIGMVLRMEIKSKGSNTYTFYSEQEPQKDNCQKNETMTFTQTIFDDSKNGSIIRCAIVNKTQHIVASVEKEIRLLHNKCLDSTHYEYNVHEFDCRRYVRCVGTRLYDIACAPGSCASSSDGSNQICSSLKCANCTAI